MGRRSGLSQEELRRRNMSSLLSRVHVYGPISRAALTAELGLNRSTIGDLTGQLEELGLVREESPSTTRRSGRPSLVVVPRRDVTVLAVAIDVDSINVGLVALGGAVIDQRRRTHHPASHDVRLVVESVAQMAQDLLALPEAGRCLGVGVSVPGAVRGRPTAWCGSRPTSAGTTSRSPPCSPTSSACRWTRATTPTSVPSPSTSAARPSASTTSRSSTAGRVSAAASWSGE